ncbi:MAG: hypothetical protein K1X90_06540 [Candidatus Kapabacteria bacterium]|nr:hypothetical protein [Candidatus Kapabacteria bacterium]
MCQFGFWLILPLAQLLRQLHFTGQYFRLMLMRLSTTRSAALPMLFLLGSLWLTSCGDDDGPTAPPPVVIPDASEPIIYSKHIQPIWENSCAGSGCHMNGDRGGGLSLETWGDLVAGAKFGGVVVPFAPRKSYLLHNINTDTALAPVAITRMPLSRDPIPMEQVLVVKRWIEEGAKNDQGEIPYGGPNRKRMFIGAQSEDKVTVVDLEQMTVARYIGVGTLPDATTPPESPHNVLLSPDGRSLFVNLIVRGRIEKYDASTFEKLGETGVGNQPAQIITTRDGATLYVSNFSYTGAPTYVVRVDAATMRVTDTIYDVGYAPHSLVLSSDERFLYSINPGGEDVTEVDLSTKGVVRRFPISPGLPVNPIGGVKYEPYHGVLSADGKDLLVTCRQSSEVRIIDLATGTVTDSIPVGRSPLICGLAPNGRDLWVPNSGANSVSIIDLASRTVIATVPGLLTQPHAVAFSTDGKKAFVSCENRSGGSSSHHPVAGEEKAPGILYVIDTSTLNILKQFDIGSFATGIAVQQ